MIARGDRERLGSKALVFAPIVVLSAIFGAFAGLVAMGPSLSSASAVCIAVIGIAVYAATVALLGRFGMHQVSRLHALGRTDSLTGLPNRRALHDDAARLARPAEEVAIALIDLDGFKLVNDHYGHVVGDQLLCECTAILRDICGREARSYRLGGDEFAILKTGPVAGTIVEGICRTLIDRFAAPVPIEDRRIAIGASVGLARSAASDSAGSSELLRRADVAMYASKRGGKMRCTWFTDDFDRNREAMQELDGELRMALVREEFSLAYQPLVDARSGVVVAVESLIRWDRPDGRRIGPNVFIPVAEESGLINTIGLWVLERSCRDALAWNEIKLSVNISAAQLRNPEFPIQLGQILEDTGFPPERLELEITETCLVLDPVVAERSLSLIRGFGVTVVLDDFGTGYASIGFLRQFRFEKLKLDRSLVTGAQLDEGSRAMMMSSISVARAMNMDVTAEGVETEAQADLVRAAGCDQIQGWLYFKAMPAAEIAAHLDKPAQATGAAGTRAA
ncbi:putative bifunctional diguanylate cyclase/phosphodiesterase [Tsuneonella amylolytica]|uniref:putative bifunctional diguanylate cyclase/phosphodiesterase n=1 Tax=Tsuneonella amylolytica TaxID=2338327 RepID=UPI001F3CE235|nr:EAL domain-containing protein [Tsuneonella amylolytica]